MIHVATGKSAFSKVIRTQQELDWDGLVKMIRDRPIHQGKLTVEQYNSLKAQKGEAAQRAARDKDTAWFSLAKYSKPERRLENVELVSGWVGDFDKGMLRPDEICERLGNLSLMVFTTYSDTPEHPKYRVIVPYSQPVSVDEHDRLFDYFLNLFDGAVDKQTRDPCRLWYFPSRAAR